MHHESNLIYSRSLLQQEQFTAGIERKKSKCGISFRRKREEILISRPLQVANNTIVLNVSLSIFESMKSNKYSVAFMTKLFKIDFHQKNHEP